MNCNIFVDEILIGSTLLKIIDPSMGGIIGDLICNENYIQFQKQIQQQTEEKGISNSQDFNYRIANKENIEIIAQGGIGIIDSIEFKELVVECSGVDLSLFMI